MWKYLGQQKIPRRLRPESHVVISPISRTTHPRPISSIVLDGLYERRCRRPLSNSIQRQQRLFSSDNTTTTTTSNVKNEGDNQENDPAENFAMPDREMEMKLANIQSTISEHYKQGDFSKALKVSKQLYQQTQSHFGQDHPATASALNNMGLMQKLLGDFVDARKHYTAALRTYAKILGRDHASYAMTLHNLASLNKAQVHFDTSLKATERLTLVETALEYFEEAWWIRKAELGKDHPLTIATQSSLGTTLAAQVLHQHRHVSGSDDNQRKQQQKYVSLNPESVTRQGWEAAEKHLRSALETSISNPRGKNIHGNKNNGKKSSNSKKGTKKGGGKKVPPPAAKKTDESTKKSDEEQQPTIETLSASSAAQNLAVFLKSRAMTEDPYNQDMLQEAHTLYHQVLRVRTQLLPNQQHPDLLATRYSLAELLEVQGDEEAANAIRQDILDDYEPSTTDNSTEHPPEEDPLLDVPARNVVVERTTGSASNTSSS